MWAGFKSVVFLQFGCESHAEAARASCGSNLIKIALCDLARLRMAFRAFWAEVWAGEGLMVWAEFVVGAWSVLEDF